MLVSPAPASLLPLAQSLLRGGSARAALRLRAARLPPGRRAVALALFRDAAQRGGSLLAPAGSDLVWIAPSAEAAAELARLCGTLFGDLAGPADVWTLPDAEALLLAWAEAAAAAAPHAAPRLPEPPFAERLAGLDPLPLLRRTTLRSRDGQASGWRLTWPEEDVAEALGLADADLARHAVAALAGRWLAAPSPLPDGDGPLLLDLPSGAAPPPPRPGAIGVLPPGAAAAPASLARRRAALAAQGWGLAIGPLTASHLALCRAAAIGGDLLLLAWSPALAEAAPRIAEADPARCVLIGCDGEEAIGFGLSAGIAWFAAA
jgi:hypothetical protein